MAKRPTGGKTSGKTAKKSKPPQKTAPADGAKNYTHPDATSLLRPDVGVQAQFRKKKPPKTYRYDSSHAGGGSGTIPLTVNGLRRCRGEGREGTERKKTPYIELAGDPLDCFGGVAPSQ